MKRFSKATSFIALALAALTFGGCAILDGTYYIEKGTFAGVDLAAKNGISFEDASYTDVSLDEQTTTDEPNFTEESGDSFRMRVYQQMNVYPDKDNPIPGDILPNDTIVVLKDVGDDVWMEAYSTEGEFLGYVKDGFMRTIPEASGVYAELPIEYGKAKDYSETYWDCYSHLVDLRKYFRCYVSTLTDKDEEIDWTQYDLKISMKLSTDDTTIKEPFYRRNLAMLQYDLLPKLKRAIDIFAEKGYTIVIYDAYRPTSVQQKWFDVVKVHAWVANPQIGLGGVHDRGCAIDMSLIDEDGKELEFATPMHTFTLESSRNNQNMSKEARKNMDYMTEVMVSCGFTYIDSEWWHFQDVNTKDYLHTDHPIDSIPLVSSEN